MHAAGIIEKGARSNNGQGKHYDPVTVLGTHTLAPLNTRLFCLTDPKENECFDTAYLVSVSHRLSDIKAIWSINYHTPGGKIYFRRQ